MVGMTTELVQYVHPDGTLTGETEEKYAAHNAHTRKHLAFSSYIFDNQGRFLVTQRASVKKVWPTVWTNTCCGHPMPGEAQEDAIRRRLAYELGITEISDLSCVIPDYSYETPPYRGIVENEYCPVYLGRLVGIVAPNPDEVDAIKLLPWDEYKAWLVKEPGIFSYWCKDQLSRLDAHVQEYLAQM